ncbi:MarR family winged helix-turn-helix transcriptional regulator [Traorella massiliensis]|uniref:MarR family winged helix-turn-helix transcriptional regulator n=1 Tax=Traorella massiliensis TaxID=1903263 RepID=UPI0008F89A75|nr:MarR family transcriptional regulator [Traorella massiliensis]
MRLPFYMLMFKVFHAQRNRMRKDMLQFQLAPGQPKVLRYISAHSECMLKEIAEECDVSAATVSKILNSLEEKKMLHRRIDPENKRAYQLRITEKGQQALDLWNEHCIKVDNISLKGFSDEEKKLFWDFLERMYENLTGKDIR